MIIPVEPKSCFHAGDFVARRGAIASICRRPASLDLGLAFRWPISRARRQMRGDRIKCLGLRTYRTSCGTLQHFRIAPAGTPRVRGRSTISNMLYYVQKNQWGVPDIPAHGGARRMYKTSKEQQLTFDGFNQSCGMKLNPKGEYVLLADMSAPTNAATLGWSTSIPWTRPTVC